MHTVSCALIGKDAIIDGKQLVSHFARIGARVRVREDVVGGLRLDIARDDYGQFFDVVKPWGVEARVVDVDPDLRSVSTPTA